MAIIHDPRKIEARSFEIIDGFLRGAGFPKPRKDIIRRVIHTTVDRSYAKDLIFSKNAIESALKALKSGALIIVDSSMVQAGINKKITAQFGNKVICRIHEKAIVAKAARLGVTRAICAMRSSVKQLTGAIVAIGNAPTALFELSDMIKNQEVKPTLVVGIPVGFVGSRCNHQCFVNSCKPTIIPNPHWNLFQCGFGIGNLSERERREKKVR